MKKLIIALVEKSNLLVLLHKICYLKITDTVNGFDLRATCKK
jgi:hypothetical protein